ncbi:hypothetical protein M514_23948 [Trichuris suis]|uniref:DDE-1 domain-containing protein n=1 Tax=Trichuris suis TaxID=68888 RepID=A0A085N3B1_9BILA|nr:hypothetical protein M514_23948 [Trichuris suis]
MKLRNVKLSGEASSADHEAAARYPEILESIMLEGSYMDQQVFNAGETGLFWKRMPTRTYLFMNEKSQTGHRVSEDRFTVLLGGNLKGNFKLKPMLVYQSRFPRALKGCSQGSPPVIFRANKKAWLTKASFEEWFLNHFCPAVQKYCKPNNIAFKALLVLDNAPSHPTNHGQLNENVKVTFMPPNTTALLQPMDQGIIATFKAYYLRETFAQALARTTGEGALSLLEFWRKYNVKNAIENIDRAWQEVSGSSMRSAWSSILRRRTAEQPGSSALSRAAVEQIADLGTKKLGFSDLDAAIIEECSLPTGKNCLTTTCST